MCTGGNVRTTDVVCTSIVNVADPGEKLLAPLVTSKHYSIECGWERTSYVTDAYGGKVTTTGLNNHSGCSRNGVLTPTIAEGVNTSLCNSTTPG